ncbi:MAG: hypothetical protein M3405_04840 [Acidobacteriota bacterium]|jgi:hypothetical protein|nr:hypothetical protein [Acidobacteriota bacterium]
MFKTLTQPKYPRAALGIEQDFVIALALQKEGKGRFGIEQAATIELPDNLLEPNFIEKNISNGNELIVFLEEAITNAGLRKNKRWSVSLPSNVARTAILTLEDKPASKIELEDVLDWKAETSFGVPSGELRISRKKISSDAEGKTRYFATAVKLSVIDEYETIFERLGWRAGLILPRAVSESRWIADPNSQADALLISSQNDGFTAMLIRGDEPAVVRSVTCSVSERDDEIYRLLVYYQDRFIGDKEENSLDKFLVIGRDFVPERLREITAEALGEPLKVLRPEDVGLTIPASNLTFDEVAAPAGIATLGF